eukprot:3997950-Pleurochrysis_carterae.AAC.1
MLCATARARVLARACVRAHLRARTCLQHVPDADGRGERVPVLDDRLAVGSVPAVELDASAAHEQHALVHLNRRLRLDLVASQ